MKPCLYARIALVFDWTCATMDLNCLAGDIKNKYQEDVALPLVIGPLSFTNAALQRHSSVYFTAAKVAERFRIPYIHTIRSPLSINAFDGKHFDSKMAVWLEVFPFVDVSVLRSLVRRAEMCGFSAFVLSLMEPYGTVTSIYPEYSDVHHIRFPDLETMEADGTYRSDTVQSVSDQNQCITNIIQFLRRLTGNSIIVNMSITKQKLIFEAIDAGVDAVSVVIDECMPFPSFIDAIQLIRRFSIKTPLYAYGSSFTEEEVIQLIEHGVERVLIDQPILWGMTIDGFDGISNVINIYKTKLLDKS